MFDIYVLIIYGVPFAVLGVITLSCVPKWRVTVGNICLFVVGGFVGSMGFLQLVIRIMSARGINGPNVFFYLFVATGAEIGGVLLVFARYVLTSSRSNRV
jgi:hypothetical protein